jgi:transcriptional regulator with XRE-family HTH domain
MSLAQRVRDCRYSKGWGPDELASRAEISRTALYQIESGKTGLPRAGTLRRIAVALSVPMEDLLGNEEHAEPEPPAADRPTNGRRLRGTYEWVPTEGGPLTLPAMTKLKNLNGVGSDDGRFVVEPPSQPKTNGHESIFVREGELMSKLHDLLHSPVGDGVASILEELHMLLPRSRSSV